LTNPVTRVSVDWEGRNDVSLTPELEKLVEEKVATGMYQTASEVVREALRLLHARDRYRFEALRGEIRAGFNEIDRGEFTDYDEGSMSSLAAAVKRRGRPHLSARGKKRRRSPPK
jgi:antitoxin ParD1/3/4